jgi:CDP-glycerol glycerophosphotransferase
MPRISVVVPMFNVERYLGECLESLRAQTFADFEAIIVDDGSTDGSPEIARVFAERDPRFRLLFQPNGGLSRARNTGIDAARGDYLAFLDSDDVLPANAYALLLGALEETGSDFATGNVHRLIRGETRQAPFLAKAFARTRLRTHVSRCRALLADRTAWNKLWRHDFWREHGLRFPEGVVHEDIPIVLPAHFMARSVDVIADPVYFYRVREGGELSITQRRSEPRILLDRLAAIDQVRTYLARHAGARAVRWYEQSLVADDLRLHLNVFDAADDAYRTLFLDRVNALLDDAGAGIYEGLRAIDRLKWHLVRRRLVPELLEVLRFERDELATTPPILERGRWYGDYPYRNDRRLRIPRSLYRLDRELTAAAWLDGLERDGGRLRVRGFAYIEGIGASTPDSQRVTVSLLRRGRLRRLRLRTSAVRLATTAVHRPDATAMAPRAMRDVAWSGFEATLDPADLRTAGLWREGVWDLYVTIRPPGIKRRASRFQTEAHRPLAAVELPASGRVRARAAAIANGGVVVDVRRHWMTVRSHRLEGGVLTLSGVARMPAGATLEALRSGDGARIECRLEIERGAFVAQVPLRELDAAAARRQGSEVRASRRGAWALWAVTGDERVRVGLPEDVPVTAWRCGDHELAVFRNGMGQASLGRQLPRPVVTTARWSERGELELRGELPDGPAAVPQLVLADAERDREHAFAVARDGEGRFVARLTPASIESLAGLLPLPEGRWELRAPAGETGSAPPAAVAVAPTLLRRLPLTAVVDHKEFSLGVTRDGWALLLVRRDLDADERGATNQHRLRETAYAARRGDPLRDAVVYSSFGGRQYSDSPRAIHEELVRRAAPLEHLWVVRDGACRVPDGAQVLRAGSREHHEALARARYVVTNDHFPAWFERRPEQICVQTWHGTPLKRLGLDLSETRGAFRRFQRRWDQQIANWQYVVSPNRFSTPILRRAYAVEGEILDTGYPRVDLLAGVERDAHTRRVRRRLGLPDGVRVVLYAPTYRDHVVDRRGRHRLDLHLDLERLHAALGAETVLLFRKHHYVTDPLPSVADGFVRDVSAYPDGTELLLAADVLVTDYSSLMVDFANSGRPMLFFAYDLDTYEAEIRGFYVDFERTVPGPLLRTTDEVVEALRDLEGVRAAHADRYEAFRATFCELDDGHATERVVDRVFAA